MSKAIRLKKGKSRKEIVQNMLKFLKQQVKLLNGLKLRMVNKMLKITFNTIGNGDYQKLLGKNMEDIKFTTQ
ncbi:hypothetical protein WQ54_09380 [Bacillus sp. SA1-12]|nr:hypothetical protein WQ54_09380 [Bacillus sp. SA1-12]